MEIERKFLVPCLPEGYDAHPFHQIEQAYLCTEPVVRIRQEDDSFYLTYKGKGLLSREEYNLPLTREAYAHLLPKADGVVLTKKRYLIPLDGSDHLTIELDVFEGRPPPGRGGIHLRRRSHGLPGPGVVWEGCYVYKGVSK